MSKIINFFLVKFSIFTTEKNLCILHGQVFVIVISPVIVQPDDDPMITTDQPDALSYVPCNFSITLINILTAT